MKGLEGIVARLAEGPTGRTEADIQADIRSVLLDAPLQLVDGDLSDVTLEAPTGGGRIDVEAGCVVIEVKKSLRPGSTLKAALAQLAAYVRDRTQEKSQRYVGVLTDGQTWILHHLDPTDDLVEVSQFQLRKKEGVDRLSAWLETVLATTENITPTPSEIVKRLGASSPAAQLDLADLRALYEACRSDPEVQVKRELWARLLLSALGKNFDDSDEMFVTHTYLVLTAELIAHEVMGLPTDVVTGDVRELLEGQQFAITGLHGVVEADFFDWPAVSPKGQPIIAGIARRLSRFNWSNVEHDILKALYESVIDVETRHRLGEYYTPDWLAEKMVNERFTDPLNQRLLDPACGSGTFLFWAVRRLLAECDAAGITNRVALERAVAQVQGMDLHPVAVTLARVTYLLALTPDRLADRNELAVPVFLGDSVRWEQDDTVLTKEGVRVSTSDPLELLDNELHFPESVVEEPSRFDRLIAELAARAADRQPETKPPRISGLLNRHKVLGEDDREAVTIAFKKLCRLHDAGRDHVWSYYIRNLIRPLSFTRAEGHVDVLIGNPPWLSYRSMPKKLQEMYRALAKERQLWAGGAVATHQDLSDLFVARSVEQYLKPGGAFAFVMPFAALSRRQFAGFRTGDWADGANASFSRAEDFSQVEPLFGVPACVVSGAKTASPSGLPRETTQWAGILPSGQLGWTLASEHLTATTGDVAIASGENESPYSKQFRQGANLVPRLLVSVKEVPGGPIGVAAGRVRIHSARSANEKKPWKKLRSFKSVVESQFVRPMHLGATVLPYRARDPQLSIFPYVRRQLVSGSADSLDEFPGLASWWREAERIWEQHKEDTSSLSLLEQIDFQGKLQKQFPIPRQRVVYTKSGKRMAACRIDNREAVIDHTLYWTAVDSVGEARYLTAILNSNTVHEIVEPLMSEGLFGKRHIDKYVFAVAFPTFDPTNASHSHLVKLAKRAERLAASLDLDQDWHFRKARLVVRKALEDSGIASEIDSAVVDLLTDTLPLANTAVKSGSTPDLMDALSKAQKKTKGKSRKKKPRPTPTKRPTRSSSNPRPSAR